MCVSNYDLCMYVVFLNITIYIHIYIYVDRYTHILNSGWITAFHIHVSVLSHIDIDMCKDMVVARKYRKQCINILATNE